jgi:hypothetical protein
MREARQALARMRTPPLTHRMLARLPGPLVREGFALRKRLRGRG